MKNNNLVEIMRALKNPNKFGLLMGEVITPLPNIKIDIGNGIVLEKDDLVFSASMLKDYTRTYSIDSTDAKLLGDKLDATGNKLDTSGVTWSLNALPFITNDTLPNATSRAIPLLPEAGGTASSFDFKAVTVDTKLQNFDMNSNDFKSTGTITLTDEIVAGDKVMIMATETNQLFYVMDKVVSF